MDKKETIVSLRLTPEERELVKQRADKDGLTISKFARRAVKNELLAGLSAYVYALLDPRKKGQYEYNGTVLPAEPYYIGKGTNNRAQHHFSDDISSAYELSDELLRQGYQKEDIIYIIEDNLTDADALEKEKELIKEIGTQGADGPLHNKHGGPTGKVIAFRLYGDEIDQLEELVENFNQHLNGKALTANQFAREIIKSFLRTQTNGVADKPKEE